MAEGRLQIEDSGDEDAGDAGFRPAPKPGPGEHPLQFNYSIWFSRRTPGNKTSSYDQSLKFIASFASVEQFWAVYSHLVRPSDLGGHSDYHLFKEGIRPMWEVHLSLCTSDGTENLLPYHLMTVPLKAFKAGPSLVLTPALNQITALSKPMSDDANKHGGKWIIRLKKGLASRCWENLILAMLGEQFMAVEEICGAVVSIRYQDDILCLWNRTASDNTTTTRIRDTLKRILQLPPNTVMEYKTHTDSIKDNSSFRNTDKFIR